MTIKRMTKWYVIILKIDMVAEESLEYRLRKTDETRIYLLDQVKQNDLRSKKHSKKRKKIEDIYAETLLILSSTITACVSIFAFASWVCVPVGITSSAVGIKVCAIVAEIKKYKSIIRKRRKSTIK